MIDLVTVSPETRKIIKKQVISLIKQGKKQIEKEIYHILIDKSPDQMKLNFMLWTRAAVCQLVQEKYGITITQRNFSKVEKINMISAISNQGNCHFLCYEESMTQQRFVDFMERLIKDTDRKVLFIVDNLKVHHGRIVRGWLSEHKDEIELFFTSPYSPEINLDEYLNHSLKQNIHSGIIPHTKEQICRKTEKFMLGLQTCREKVSCYFQHKKLEYIKMYG